MRTTGAGLHAEEWRGALESRAGCGGRLVYVRIYVPERQSLIFRLNEEMLLTEH